MDQGGEERGEMDPAFMPRFRGQTRCGLHLFVLAYNLGNFLRQAVLPPAVRHGTMTTLREKLIKIGAKVVRHARKVVFQMAEVAVPGSCSGTSSGQLSGCELRGRHRDEQGGSQNRGMD